VSLQLKMSHAEDIPQPENASFVLVTGANRYELFQTLHIHSIDVYLAAWDWASAPA
jgi:hypothetical protein